jgi:ParB family chromosome partitioning protein
LLKLDPILQTGMRDGFISMGHGRAMINVENTEDQLAIYEKILREKLSVRQTEDLVKSLKSATVAKPKKKQVPAFIKSSIKDISEYFGHKIDVSIGSNGKGKIAIPFHSEEDFNRIKNLLK